MSCDPQTLPMYPRIHAPASTVELLHARLDAMGRDPCDHALRLVLADALDEAGDPRAAGYRALGLHGLYTHTRAPVELKHWTWFSLDYRGDDRTLPRDWFNLLPGGHCRHTDETDVTATCGGIWRDYDTRREAEDAAADAFIRLPADRQNELLAALYAAT